MTQRELAQRIIASLLDHPSVYMGGPSKQNMRKAERILQYFDEYDAIDYRNIK